MVSAPSHSSCAQSSDHWKEPNLNPSRGTSNETLLNNMRKGLISQLVNVWVLPQVLHPSSNWWVQLSGFPFLRHWLLGLADVASAWSKPPVTFELYWSTKTQEVFYCCYLQEMSVPLSLARHSGDLESHHMLFLSLRSHTAHNLKSKSNTCCPT